MEDGLAALAHYLVSLAPGLEVKAGDALYTARSLTPVAPDPPRSIEVSTLTAVVDFVNAMKGTGVGNPFDSIFAVVVESIDAVSVPSPLDPFNRRAWLLAANAQTRGDLSDGFMSPEAMTIAILANFEQTETARQLLAVVGNLTAESTVAIEDDGVSQRVSLRQGVTRQKAEIAPTGFSLRPFITFPEIEQPEVPHFLRLRKTAESISVALFRTHSIAWKIETHRRIAAWLREHLPAGTVVLE